MFLKKETDFYQSIRSYISGKFIFSDELKNSILDSLDQVIKF